MSGQIDKKADNEARSAELEALLKAAKDFANEIRVECGLRRTGKLKKGYRCDALLIPLATALEGCGVLAIWAEGGRVVMTDGTRSLTYDRPEVVAWCNEYDDGAYPELVIPPTPIKIKKPGERKATIL